MSINILEWFLKNCNVLAVLTITQECGITAYVCHNDPGKVKHNNSKTIHSLNLNNITSKK